MSLMNQTIETLKQLRNHGMAKEFENISSNPNLRPSSFEEGMARCVQREIDDRENKRLSRNLKAAKLRYPNACIEDIEFRPDRGLDRDLVAYLAGGDWIDRDQNVILTGLAGVGKTYKANALGNQALRQGRTVSYKRYVPLIEEIELALATGALAKLKAKLCKPDLLIIDDWAIAPMTPVARVHLLDVIEERSGNGSLIITAQLPVSGWHDFIGEPTIADAILDRVVHRAHQIELKGESMRKLKESV